MFTLRPYQTECVEAVNSYICSKSDNPCVVIPTGGGKTVVMAALMHKWYEECPWIRGCILAHRKELVRQNHDKLASFYADCPIGIYSAGLGERDHSSQIIFASIDSIYKKAGEFKAFDFLFVDEAHRIPPNGQGKYRQFIGEARKMNKDIRVIGWTATPFRMGCGPICHKDYILNKVCYEAGVADLIEQGYLCNLRSKVGSARPDLSKVRRNSGGDYVVKSLAAETNRRDLVEAAVSDALRKMQSEGRKSAIFFCVNVDHCHRVSNELAKYDITAPAITAKTPVYERDRVIQRFKDRVIKVVCCVNVLTEGFDAPHIDTVVLLRPTLSAGLFAQMVGRGLRLHESKEFCLVLDYAGCIEEHGPLDLLGSGEKVPMHVCAKCEESFPRPLRACPACGWVIPPREVERLEAAEEAERRMHEAKAAQRSILSGEPEIFDVQSVTVAPHVKPLMPTSVKVRYRICVGGASRWVNEWVCLDHEGYAKHKAYEWWRERFGKTSKIPTVAGALNDMFVNQRLSEWTKTITVKREGKHLRVIGYNEKPKG